jgi:ATP-dependent DNA helicase PIF1
MEVEIAKKVLSGENVLLHGPGGCGKSYTIRLLYKKLKSLGKKVQCTATTGIAALNLSGPGIKTRTLHSWAGIGLGRETGYKLAAKVRDNYMSRRRWQDTQVLIIDEVSMLGATLFKKLDIIGRIVRGRRDEPFGGIRLVLSGDFLQLPPVKDTWLFETDEWKELNLKCVPFMEAKRYDDPDYFQTLLRIRRGAHTEADIEMLQERVKAYDEYLVKQVESGEASLLEVKPTLLYSKKRDVEAYNLGQLENLPDKPRPYTAKDNYNALRPRVRKEKYELMLDDAIKKAIILKVGAQVMLKANLDIDEGLVNGSRGVVTDMGIDFVDVKFRNQDTTTRIMDNTWSVEDDDMEATRTQIPLILAWASTIHKSQGCTIDFAVCDIGSSVFADGQAYVALSRVRNRAGLFLSDLHPPAIEANEEAVRYVNKIETREVKFLVTFTAPHTQNMLKKEMFQAIEKRIKECLEPNSHLYIHGNSIIDQVPTQLFLKGIAQNLTIISPDGKLPKIVSKIPVFKRNLKKAIEAGAQKTDVFIADRCIVIDWGEPTVAANEILSQYPKKEYIDLLSI